MAQQTRAFSSTTTLTGSQFAAEVLAFVKASESSNSGPTAPVTAVVGKFWVDTSNGVDPVLRVCRQLTGSVDEIWARVMEFDLTDSKVRFLDGVEVDWKRIPDKFSGGGSAVEIANQTELNSLLDEASVRVVSGVNNLLGITATGDKVVAVSLKNTGAGDIYGVTLYFDESGERAWLSYDKNDLPSGSRQQGSLRRLAFMNDFNSIASIQDMKFYGASGTFNYDVSEWDFARVIIQGAGGGGGGGGSGGVRSTQAGGDGSAGSSGGDTRFSFNYTSGGVTHSVGMVVPGGTFSDGGVGAIASTTAKGNDGFAGGAGGQPGLVSLEGNLGSQVIFYVGEEVITGNIVYWWDAGAGGSTAGGAGNGGTFGAGGAGGSTALSSKLYSFIIDLREVNNVVVAIGAGGNGGNGSTFGSGGDGGNGGHGGNGSIRLIKLKGNES